MQLPTEEKNDGAAIILRFNSTAYMGLLLAFALILSYVETLVPLQIGIPGVKLGLANLAVVLCLYLLGWREALLLTVVKAFLSGLLFGNLFMILYSLAGAVLSAVFMILLKKSGWFHIPAVSACGGVMHNMGQLLIAMKVVDTYGVLYYLPVLIVAGLITGLVLGMAASLLLPGLQKLLVKGNFK
ncbi:MAG: Gx transporter family protein [Clostridium sp.]|nr:Gx transporter family protein [Clostridium sp.]